MSNKETFTSNLDAITHDSDPRYLRFQGLSQDPAKMGGEGKIIADYGTEVELTNANPLGSGFVPGITGPSVNELIGGGGNLVSFTLKGPDVFDTATFGDLIDGVSTIVINFTDAGPAVIIPLTYLDIISLATAQGLVGLNQGTIDISSLVPGSTSTLGTRTIDSVEYTLPSPLYDVSVGTLTSITGVLQITRSATLVDVGLPRPLNADNIQGPGLGFLVDSENPTVAIFIAIHNVTNASGSVIIPIDAASILTNPQTTHIVLDPYSQDWYVDWDHVYFAGYEGWTVVGESITAVGGYGVSAHGPLAATSIINTLMVVSGGGSEFGHIQPLDTPVATPAASIVYAVDGTTHLRLFIRTDPATTPATDPPILVTEPYEIRQRNLPAFKFSFNGTIGESSPQISLKCLVSQGDPTGNYDNTHREWTQISVNSVVLGTVYKDVLNPSLNVSQQYTNLPDNFSGSIITLSKDFIGPWNYIRFIIFPTGEQTYDGIYLQIIANAREL